MANLLRCGTEQNLRRCPEATSLGKLMRCPVILNCIIFTIGDTEYKFQRFGTTWQGLSDGNLVTDSGGVWVLSLAGSRWHSTTGYQPPTDIGVWVLDYDNGVGSISAIVGTIEDCEENVCSQCGICCYSNKSYLTATWVFNWTPVFEGDPGTFTKTIVMPWSNYSYDESVGWKYINDTTIYYPSIDVYLREQYVMLKMCWEYPDEETDTWFAPLINNGSMNADLQVAVNSNLALLEFSTTTEPTAVSNGTCCGGSTSISGVCFVTKLDGTAADYTDVTVSVTVDVVNNLCCHNIYPLWDDGTQYNLGDLVSVETSEGSNVYLYFGSVNPGVNVNHNPIDDNGDNWVDMDYCEPITYDVCLGGEDTVCGT